MNRSRLFTRRNLLFLLPCLALLALLWPSSPRLLVAASLPMVDQVVTLDARTGEIVARVEVPDQPLGLCFTPLGDRVFVAARSSGEIASIDTATWQVTQRYPVLPEPMAVLTDKKVTRLQVFHAGLREDRLYELAGSSPRAGSSARMAPAGQVPRVPLRFANVKEHDGVAAPPTEGRYRFSINKDVPEVLVSDSKTRQVVSSIPVGECPLALGWSPDRSKLYAVVGGEAVVRVIDPEELRVTRSIPVDSDPNYFKPIGNTWYAALTSRRAGTVSIVDMRNDRVAQRVPVGGDIDWIDVWPPRSGR